MLKKQISTNIFKFTPENIKESQDNFYGVTAKQFIVSNNDEVFIKDFRDWKVKKVIVW
jgi:hypothetical protein